MCVRVLMIARIWTRSLSPEDKAAVARLAIKNRRRPPEASADQPEAQAVRSGFRRFFGSRCCSRQCGHSRAGYVVRLPRHARSHGRRQWPTPYRRSGLPTQLGFLRCFNSGRRTLGGVEHHCHAQRRLRVRSAMTLLSAVSYRHQSGHWPPVARRHRIGDAPGRVGDCRRSGLHVCDAADFSVVRPHTHAIWAVVPRGWLAEVCCAR